MKCTKPYRFTKASLRISIDSKLKILLKEIKKFEKLRISKEFEIFISPIERLEQNVCKIFETTVELIHSKRRILDTCTYPRYVVWNHLWNEEKWSVTRIGLFYDRDHSTVLHGIGQYNNLYGSDKDFRTKADIINSLI